MARVLVEAEGDSALPSDVTTPESMTVRILDMIEAKGGMRYRDIQAALYAMSAAGNVNVRPAFDRHANRGWWSTNLSKLLPFFCNKEPNGLITRNDVPHEGHPWKVVSRIKDWTRKAVLALQNVIMTDLGTGYYVRADGPGVLVTPHNDDPVATEKLQACLDQHGIEHEVEEADPGQRGSATFFIEPEALRRLDV